MYLKYANKELSLNYEILINKNGEATGTGLYSPNTPEWDPLTDCRDPSDK